MATAVRAFIAIHLPEAVLAYLGERQAEWMQTLPHNAVRWVKPDAMHLTLRFLGDTPSAKIEQIAAALDTAAAVNSNFGLFLDATGCFPNPRRPRVFWVGLRGELASADYLKQAVDNALQPLGWEPERRSFKPHLTIGRIKDARKLNNTSLPLNVLLEPLRIDVDAIHLIRSDLKPSGPVYTVLHTSHLSGPG
ncbi:MAG: RNA 2',3'-cyclic phosphodiesterase [Anaerolineae bacterium]|nr:RNA 2',3'-cyclic phosphodiesterase [Anaerolineae bacterium]